MKLSLIIKNIKRLANWLSKSPQDAEYNRLLKEFKENLLNIKMKTLAIEFSCAVSIKHDKDNVFNVDDEIIYVLTSSEYEDFTPEMKDIVNSTIYQFDFDKYIISKDQQLVVFKAKDTAVSN